MAPAPDVLRLLGPRPLATLCGAFLIVVAGYVAWTVVYNLFLSPLRKIPGPKLWAVSQFPYSRLLFSGEAHQGVRALHAQYGDVVRIAPDQVSIVDPRLWKEGLGHRRPGRPENGRDPVAYTIWKDSIVGAITTEEHATHRRILSPGFSSQSLLEQQPLIRQYVDMLMLRLKENCQGGQRALDMTKWYNWTTFDIISDLAFGEPFGCLKDSSYHPWVALIFASTKQGLLLAQLRRHWWGLESFIRQHLLRYIAPSRAQNMQLAVAKVAKRMAAEDRPDFMRAMLGKDTDGKDKLTTQQITLNAQALILAGSETTATVLSATTYLLGTHPEVWAKLQEEVLSSFSSEDDIDILSVQQPKYMHAVLSEALRMYPPVPGPAPRRVPKGGNLVCDRFLPKGTTILGWQWAILRSPENFTLPDSFIPERWLGDERFANDRKDAYQPFSHGPRNCIGKNLAYVEMKLILSRLIWNFELRLAEPKQDWIGDSRVYQIWDKPALMVHLSPRQR